MKLHFDPYRETGEDCIHALCGTVVGEEYESTTLWIEVTCKRCLVGKKKINEWVKETEKAIIKEMGDMANFMMNEEENEKKNS